MRGVKPMMINIQGRYSVPPLGKAHASESCDEHAGVKTSLNMSASDGSLLLTECFS